MKPQNRVFRSPISEAMRFSRQAARAIAVVLFIGAILTAVFMAVFALWSAVTAALALAFQDRPVPYPTTLPETFQYFAPALIPAVALLAGAAAFKAIEIALTPPEVDDE